MLDHRILNLPNQVLDELIDLLEVLMEHQVVVDLEGEYD
jgi:hypothetical protein